MFNVSIEYTYLIEDDLGIFQETNECFFKTVAEARLFFKALKVEYGSDLVEVLMWKFKNNSVAAKTVLYQD